MDFLSSEYYMSFLVDFLKNICSTENVKKCQFIQIEIVLFKK